MKGNFKKQQLNINNFYWAKKIPYLDELNRLITVCYKGSGLESCLFVTLCSFTISIFIQKTRRDVVCYPGGGTPIYYQYGYVPPNEVVILKLPI